MNVAKIRETRQLENAAFRQAGQAVAAAELRVPFKAVELTEVDGRAVEMGWPGTGPLCDEQRREREDLALLVWLSGVLAEEKFCGSATLDAFSAVETCKQASREALQLLDRCRAWIANPQPWAAICQVAAELLVRRRMTAAAVQSIALAADAQ